VIRGQVPPLNRSFDHCRLRALRSYVRPLPRGSAGPGSRCRGTARAATCARRARPGRGPRRSTPRATPRPPRRARSFSR
jgi:hypothetical protein